MKPCRAQFPILTRKIKGKPLVYLDNAATTQKPKSVIDTMVRFYHSYNANIHRGLHTMSEESTEACDMVRTKVQKFIKAKNPSEIIFTNGTTMGINLVAYTWAEKNLHRSDEIIISLMEHHANIVPWQRLEKRKGIKLSYAPLTKSLELDYAALQRMITKKTKLVSLVHVSNVLGVENDITRIVSIVRKKSESKVLIDAAQSIAHMPIDVKKLDIDFLAFSGHKMYGPTGIGVLYAKKELLEKMPPFLTGGDMIIEVNKHDTVFLPPPQRFEAGTPHVAGIIGLGAAIDFIRSSNIKKIQTYERMLTTYMFEKLSKVPNLTIYGPRKRHGIICFNLKGIHAHDVAEIANRYGVALRSGNHCCMPLHRSLKVSATARASIACYNTKKEIDILIKSLKEVQKIFS